MGSGIVIECAVAWHVTGTTVVGAGSGQPMSCMPRLRWTAVYSAECLRRASD